MSWQLLAHVQPDDTSTLDLVQTVGTVVATVVALAAIGTALRRWWRRTPGRRRDRYDRLTRLGTGAQLSFFESVLGEPPAVQHTITHDAREFVYSDDPRFDPTLAPPDDPVHETRVERKYTESVFIDRDFYVQTVANSDDTVLAFSVTTRSRGFNPTFEWPTEMNWRRRRQWRRATGEKYRPFVHVRLGRTRFSDFGDAETDDFAGPSIKFSIGAHNYCYSEFDYRGYPGAYQSFVYTASDVAQRAYGKQIGSFLAMSEEIGGTRWPRNDYGEESGEGTPASIEDGDKHLAPRPDEWDGMVATRAFRRETVVTTYTVIASELDVAGYPTSFGPHERLVHTLP